MLPPKCPEIGCQEPPFDRGFNYPTPKADAFLISVVDAVREFVDHGV
jgi:hypothetical protein